MKNFLNISDINSEDLKQIVEEAKIRKKIELDLTNHKLTTINL